MKKTLIIASVFGVLTLFSFTVDRDTVEISTKSEVMEMDHYGSIEYTYYTSVSEFNTALKNVMLQVDSDVAATGVEHGISVIKTASGSYGMSGSINLGGAGFDPGSTSFCDCQEPGQEAVQSYLDLDPDWWLVEFTDGVWGWG